MRQNKKILILCNALNGGGAEKVTQTIANYLSDSKKYSVTIAALNDGEGREGYSEEIKILSCRRPDRPTGRRCAAWLLFRVKQLLLCLRCVLMGADCVLALREGLPMLLAPHIRAKKRIAWLHNDMYNFRILKPFFLSEREELRHLKKFSKIVCVSRYVYQSVVDTIGDPGNMAVCYNPVNVNAIKAAAKPQSVPEDLRPVFVSVCRLSREKRVLELLRICNDLSASHRFSLWIIGDGPERPEAEAYIAAAHLSNVKLLGWKDNPYTHIKSADWLISASTCESYGLTVQEAVICGTPVLTSYLPVLRECLPDGKALITGKSMDELKSSMLDILEHPEINQKLRANSVSLSHDALYSLRLNEICALIENTQKSQNAQ